VIGLVVVPTAVFLLFALAPFLDRSSERRALKRPIATSAFIAIVVSLFLLGFLSDRDDRRDKGISSQLAKQKEEVDRYMSQPFKPVLAASATAASGPMSPQAATGKAVFEAHKCVLCHGDGGTGTKLAPRLVGIGSQLSADQMAALVRSPNAKMKAGGMPPFQGTDDEMHALIAYLQSLR
jgi:menaquinol-cytochrome c reductase cytochrome b/c subunit